MDLLIPRPALAFLAAAMLAACNRAPAPQSPQAEPTPQARSEHSATAQNEPAWIVQSILHDLVEMAVFAKTHTPLAANALELQSLPADAGGYHYLARIHLPGIEEVASVPVDITGSIWDSAAYQPAARVLLEKLGVAGNADGITVHESAVRTLTAPQALNLQRENQRVSAMLSAHPLSPEAHEQAALVVGVLGLRENSGALWNPEGFCNRATAHLALARALRGAEALSDAGEIAELLTSLEADTKADSEQRIARLRERNNPELAPWINAALMRNRRDWRVLEKRGSASLLERIEYFRAKCEAVSPDLAGEELWKTSPEQVSDWCNILLQFDFSVGSGHRYTSPALKMLLVETEAVFPEGKAMQLNAENLAKVLNKDPGGPVQKDEKGKWKLVPIDDGAWAHFFQRHLIHAATRTDFFLRDRWGVPDEAAKFEDSIGKLFDELTLAPFLHVLWSIPKHIDHSGDAQAEALIRQHPEWVTETPWAKVHAAAPALAAWFSSGLPPGTAYRFGARHKEVPAMKHLDANQLKNLYDLAPWQLNVVQAYLKALYGEKPTPDQARSILGPFLDFHFVAMECYASYNKENVPEYVAIYERMAQLDPDQYLNLSEYYRDHHMDEKAAEAYQAGIDHDANAVWAANECGWLVNYYYDHDQKARALQVAKFAAEVYSYRGLQTFAKLQERMGNPAQAETYFEKINERYKDNLPLLAFYVRQTVANPSYAAKVKSNLGSIFPNGLETVAMENFTAAPQKGVLINEESPLLAKNGLKRGDIIVALDGKRVQSFPQYKLVRELTESPHLELIIYHAGAYKQVQAEAPNRRFGADFCNWP
ncbi:MAG: hypothetical protein ACFUZC_15530 [Chthoniobacteraceae bacterium]